MIENKIRIDNNDKTVFSPFGYHSTFFPAHQTGIDLVMGADHGAGRFCLIMKANLLFSLERRTNGHIEHGSREYTFGQIKCRKDTAEITYQVSAPVNEMIAQFHTQKLMGVKASGSQAIALLYIDKAAKDVQTVVTNDSVYLSWTLHKIDTTETKRQKVDIETNARRDNNNNNVNTYQVWEVIQNFNLFGCGDLAFLPLPWVGRIHLTADAHTAISLPGNGLTILT